MASKFKYGQCEWVAPGVPPHDLGPGRGGRKFCSHNHQMAAYRADITRVDELAAFIDGNGFAVLRLNVMVDTLPRSANPKADAELVQTLQASGFDERTARTQARRFIEYTPESRAKHANRDMLLIGEVIKRYPEAMLLVGVPAVATLIRRLPAGAARWTDAIQFADVMKMPLPCYDAPTRRALGEAPVSIRERLAPRRPAAAVRTPVKASPPRVNHPPLIPGNIQHRDEDCGQCAAARRILPSLYAAANSPVPFGAAEASLMRNAVAYHLPVPPDHWNKITTGGRS
jgi:hypothetical protein